MQKTNNRFLGFIKRNAFYLVLSLCIIAVGVSLILIFATGANELPSDNIQVEAPSVDNPAQDNTDVPSDTVIPDTPSTDVNAPNDTPVIPDAPVISVIEFVMPVNNCTDIVEYSEQMVFNSTLNRYSAHKAIDFLAQEGANVYAVYGGRVVDVSSSMLKGTSVTIDHGDGLITIYSSLADGDSVTVGQVVEQGEVIGTVSSTNRQEAHNGAHLHFEVKENGEIIDPEKYLSLNKK